MLLIDQFSTLDLSDRKNLHIIEVEYFYDQLRCG